MLGNAGENSWGVGGGGGGGGECDLLVDDQLQWSVAVYISLEHAIGRRTIWAFNWNKDPLIVRYYFGTANVTTFYVNVWKHLFKIVQEHLNFAKMNRFSNVRCCDGCVMVTGR